MQTQRYDFVHPLASGQMSDVWLALDRKTSMQVAVKIMKLGDDEARNAKTAERFQREITIAQELRHPQILPILDYGYMLSEVGDNGRHVPYLVSPYIPEGSLVSLLETRDPWLRWTLPQVADAVLQAAECLWFLHTRTPPIVHEDVKPGNFLYRSINSPERSVLLYLFDFGISRRKSPSFAIASEVVGTLEFMAPEQIRQQVDCASDQYALAVMASLLLTGQYPIHVEKRSEYVVAQQEARPFAPSELYPERLSSPEVDAIMLRALAKDPAQRFPTVLSFGQELQRAIQAFSKQSFYASSTAHPGNEPTEPTEQATDQPQVHPAIGQRATEGRIAFTFDSPETHDGRQLNDPLPPRPARPTTDVVGRSASVSAAPPALSALSQQLLPVPLRQSLPARARMLCWSPNGALVAAVLYGSVIVYAPADATILNVVTANAQRATGCCWSPDGTVLAVAGQRQLCFWELATHTTLPLTIPCSQNTIEGLDWSAQDLLALWLEDQIVLYTLSHTSLTRRTVPEPRRIPTGSARCGSPGTLRFAPDGRYLAMGASDGELLCWPLEQIGGPLRLAPRGQKVQSLAWSSDASLLCAATKDCCIQGWDMRTRQAVLQWSSLPAMPRSLAISSEQQIAVASSEPRLLLGFSNLSSPDCTLPGQLIVAWSSTQSQLATLDIQDERMLLIWQLERAAMLR
ncbi:protein kinase [Ktedonobacteria bacterium brp13]|nr:protein kinase [Ktedonobacteria bacterium brp13]